MMALQRDRTVFFEDIPSSTWHLHGDRPLPHREVDVWSGGPCKDSLLTWNLMKQNFKTVCFSTSCDNLTTSLRHLTTMIFGLLVLQVFCAPCLYFGSSSYLSWFRTSLVFVESSELTKTSLDSCRMEKTKEALQKKIFGNNVNPFEFIWILYTSESNCHKCHNCNNYVTKWIAPSHRIAQWISPSTKEVLQSLKIQSESKRHFHRNFDFKQISSSSCWNCLNLDHSADRYSSVKNRRGSCTSMLPSFSQDWSDLMIRRCQVATIEANKCSVNCQTIMRIYLYTWSEYYRSKLLLSIWPKGVTPLVFKPCQGGHRHSWSKEVDPKPSPPE